MDIVYIIITVMLVCAAACAIVLVWPAKPSNHRTPPATEGAARDAGRGGTANS
ncbi:MAG TPA: hypothetical protein VFO28_04420 [Burkholderiaceae bacterium]|nr:hypothetical protein [Burkholderiaceae bacterium]